MQFNKTAAMAAALLALSTAAQAGTAIPPGTVLWNAEAIACAPKAGTTIAGFNATFGATIKTGSVGTYELFCSVSLPLNLPAASYDLILSYADSTGVAQPTYVSATLYEQKRKALATSPVATVNSNTSPVTGINSLAKTFIKTFDPLSNSYFVGIRLSRVLPTDRVSAFSVAIATH